MSNQRKKSKRLYLINRDFQLRYVRAAIIVGLSSTLLTTALLLWPLFQFKIIRFPNFLPWPFLAAIFLGALINFIFVAGLGILMTHRIAGPMFALVRQMRVVQHGNFRAQLAVRQLDDLKYLIRNFNEMTTKLVDITTEDLAKLNRIATIIDFQEGDLQRNKSLGSKFIGNEAQSLSHGNSEATSPSLAEALSLLEEMRQSLESRICDTSARSNQT